MKTLNERLETFEQLSPTPAETMMIQNLWSMEYAGYAIVHWKEFHDDMASFKKSALAEPIA